eukprot:372979-Rhodomonas_salina.1
MGERGRVSERQVVEHVNEEESEGCIVGGDAGPGATAIIVGVVAWISLSSHKLQVPPSSSEFLLFSLLSCCMAKLL